MVANSMRGECAYISGRGEGREYKEITDKAHLEKSGIRFNFAKPKRPCLVPDNANVYPDQPVVERGKWWKTIPQGLS